MIVVFGRPPAAEKSDIIFAIRSCSDEMQLSAAISGSVLLDDLKNAIEWATT